VPPNAPVKLYWSATAYDRASHALIRDQSRPSRSSLNVDLQKNADGSTDVYFGPKAPAGCAAAGPSARALALSFVRKKSINARSEARFCRRLG
jgi:hypothetical protein